MALGEISGDKVKNSSDGDFTGANTNGDTIDIKWCSIGQYSQLVVDSNRHVAGTSNNPNSSRSHDIVKYVFNLKNNDKSLMVVGDLAGSESKFACDVPSMVNAFANLKNDNDKSGKKYYYYNDMVPEERTDIADFSNDDKVLEMFQLRDKTLLNCAKGVFFLMTSSKYKTIPNNINGSTDTDQRIISHLILSGANQLNKTSDLISLNAAWENGLKTNKTTIFSTIIKTDGILIEMSDVQESIDKFNDLMELTTPIPDANPAAVAIANEVKTYVKQFAENEGDKIMKTPNEKILLTSDVVRGGVLIEILTKKIYIGGSNENIIGMGVTQISNKIMISKDTLDDTDSVIKRPDNFYIGVTESSNNYIMDACFVTKSKDSSNSLISEEQIEGIIDDKDNINKTVFFLCLFNTTPTGDLIKNWKDTSTKIVGIIKISKGSPSSTLATFGQSRSSNKTTIYTIEYASYYSQLTSQTKFTHKKYLYRTDTFGPLYDSVKNISQIQKFDSDKITVTTKILEDDRWAAWKPPDSSSLEQIVKTPVVNSETVNCAIGVKVPKLGTIKVPGTMTITVNTTSSTTVTTSLRYKLEEALINKKPERQKIVEILESYKNYIGIRKLVIEKCNLRTMEGVSINKLLSDMRKAIEIIYSVKNAKRATLPLSVLYGTDMFKKPLDQILFNKEITDDIILKTINESDIIFSIFNFVIKQNIIKFQQGETDPQKYAMICQQMTVILICVINISKMTEKKTAEDNLQYLSINELQKLYQEMDINKGRINTNDDLTARKIKIIELIEQYYEILDKYKTETGRVCSVNSDALQLKNAVGNPKYTIINDKIQFSVVTNGCRDKLYENDLQKKEPNVSTISNIYDEDISDNRYSWSFLHVLMRIRILGSETPKQKQEKIDLFILTLKSIIELFDNFNSPTTLGTVKAMSKLLNGVSTDILQIDYEATLGSKMRIKNLTENEISAASV